jgi:NAD(P)-dependent dehydrogenase (short-subunit alcohol dehydrogenase family)
MVDAVVQQFGRIHILVNSAGVFRPGKITDAVRAPGGRHQQLERATRVRPDVPPLPHELLADVAAERDAVRP